MSAPTPTFRTRFRAAFAPYADISIFVVTLLVANYFWKFTVLGDESGTMVTWFGLDITAPFDILCCHITTVVLWLIGLFRDTCVQDTACSFHFLSGVLILVEWSCSGLKQTFIWTMLMLTTRGGWKHKTWFIPLGWLCIYVFNILRIVLISLLTEFHPERFDFLHAYLFKYLFYAMLFALWLLFTHYLSTPRPNPKQATSTSQDTSTLQ